MTGEFVGLGEAAARLGVCGLTLRRRVRRDGVVLYADPGDERRRLLAAADVERLAQPRPLETVGCTAPRRPGTRGAPAPGGKGAAL